LVCVFGGCGDDDPGTDGGATSADLGMDAGRPDASPLDAFNDAARFDDGGLDTDASSATDSSVGDAGSDAEFVDGGRIPVPCDAQYARGIGTCDTVVGIFWNGTACAVSRGCTCEGADCAATFTTTDDCELLYLHCIAGPGCDVIRCEPGYACIDCTTGGRCVAPGSPCP